MKMLRRLVLAIIVAGFGYATATSGTSAKEWSAAGSFAWLANGQVTVLEKDHYYWVGRFTGVVLTTDASSPINGASETCPGYNDIGRSAGGYCVIADANGDLLFLTWQSDSAQPVSHGSWTYTGGTGKFEGASGGGKFEGHFSGVPFADGSQSGYSVLTEGKLTLP